MPTFVKIYDLRITGFANPHADFVTSCF